MHSRRSLSQFDQLQVAHLVIHATWFFTEDHVTFFVLNSLQMDFVHDPIWTSPTCYRFLSSVLRLSRWHFETILPLEDRFRILASCQQVKQNSVPVSWSWKNLDPLSHCLWHLSSDRIRFPGGRRRTTRVWLMLLLVRLPIAPKCHLRSRSWGWESFA